MVVSFLSLMSQLHYLDREQRDILSAVQRLAVVLAVDRYMVWPLSR